MEKNKPNQWEDNATEESEKDREIEKNNRNLNGILQQEETHSFKICEKTTKTFFFTRCEREEKGKIFCVLVQRK